MPDSREARVGGEVIKMENGMTKMRFAAATLAVVLATAATAATAQPAPQAGQLPPASRALPFSLSDFTGKLNMIEAIGDVGSWVGPKPEPIPEFSYAEKRAFDMQLHQSLKAGLPAVNVLVGGAATRSKLPERLSQWLKAVEKSGGAVRHCAVESNERLFGLLAVGLQLIRKVDKWLLYRPAGGYDLMLVTNGGEGMVLNALFTERGAAKTCPDGTREVGSEAVSS